MKELDRIHKALGNRRRLNILKYLKMQKEATVGDIARYLKLSFRATSRHLLVLRSADLLKKDQRGLLVYYSLNSSNPILKQTLIHV